MKALKFSRAKLNIKARLACPCAESIWMPLIESPGLFNALAGFGIAA
jgi:hypothetical protein